MEKIRIEQRLRFADERLRTRAPRGCSVVALILISDWKCRQRMQIQDLDAGHVLAGRQGRDALSPRAENILTLSSEPEFAERFALRAGNHMDAFGSVTNSSPRAARELSSSLEVNRETGWRDNKLCLPMRDIFSCLHFIGGYPATSNKRTNGL
ncbi:MAG TPA: hypothetical protein VNH16_20850, partial [Burkholderiales bacterium]|nr:hypothetical protein [Burkholderiales bacterium]